jgi:hypothetical protein
MSDFSIIFVSETKRDHLLVEIHFKKQRLCQINKEKGCENLEIEFLTDIYISTRCSTLLGREILRVQFLS